MEALLKDIVADIVASIIAAPILFVAGFYARPLWDRLAGRKTEETPRLPASEVVYLIALTAILGGSALVSAYYAEKLIPTSSNAPVSRSTAILALTLYIVLSSVLHFLGLNVLSNMKVVYALDVSAGSPTDTRNRIFAAVTMVKLSVFLLISGWALWASPLHRLEPFLFGLFFLFFIDIIGAIAMLLLD